MVHAADVAIAAAQVPRPGRVSLDHIAHFVSDIEGAAAALQGLGFTLTPFSPQSHRLQAAGPLVAAGTGNQCVMFERGYIELLTPTGETAHADQLRTQIARYIGIHLIAFGTADAETDHARLLARGFQPLQPVDLQRPIATESGEDTARFAVVRVPPDAMPEGRIQFCHQRTPGLLWQRRWLAHANGTRSLGGVVLCVADPAAAARRYGDYTGVAPQHHSPAWRIELERGIVYFVDGDALRRALGVEAPALPWICGALLETADLRTTERSLRRGQARITHLAGGRLMVELPPSIGGLFIYGEAGSGPLVFA